MPAYFDQRQVSSYTKTGHLDEFEIDEGVVYLPKAEMPPTNPAELAVWSPVVAARVHAPYRKKTVHFKSTKSGSPPVMPSMKDSGAFKFVGGTVTFQQPQLDGSMGNYTWTAMGELEFYEACRSNQDDGFVLTNLPFTLRPAQEAQQSISPATPLYGAVARAGEYARVGYAVAAQMTSLDTPDYTYTITGFVPGLFFNDQMVNGYSPVVQG